MTTLVVDVEATCWPDEQPELRGRQREISEIIEIGAVRLEGPELEPTGEYQAFVQPIAYPELSAFCMELTSIRQEDVDSAPPYPEAWARFAEWIGPDTAEVVMASWSAYDQHLFVRQCREHGIEDEPGWSHIDLKAEFGRWIFGVAGVRKRFRLSAALDRAGIDVSGTAHRALDDARNTAKLLRYIREPEHACDLTKHALKVMAERDPRPTHIGHLRELLPDPKAWFPRVRHEALRMGLAADLGGGRGLVLTAYGHQVLPALQLDALGPPTDPEGAT